MRGNKNPTVPDIVWCSHAITAAIPQGNMTQHNFEVVIRKASEIWAIPDLNDHIDIAFSSRLRTSFGRTQPARGRIRLHPRLDQHAILLDEVLVHELAHVAVHLLHGPGRRPHGREWRSLVEQTGRPARVRIAVALAGAAPTRRKTKRRFQRRFTHHAVRYLTQTANRCRRAAGRLVERLAFVFVLALCLQMHGNTAAAEPPVSPDIVIRNARIIVGTGKVIEGGSLTITGDRISTVVAEPVSVTAVVEIDATGLTVLPGLIDAYRHLLIDPHIDSEAAFTEWRDAHLAAMFQGWLESGFTTVLSAGDYHPAINEIKERLADGTLQGPRLLVLSHAFTAPDGHPVHTICKNNRWCQDTVASQIGTPAAARAKVREYAESNIDGFKLIYDGLIGAKLDDAVFAAITDEARQLGLPVFAHASNVEDMLRAVELGADRLVHPPYFGTVGGTDTAQKLRAASMMITTTISRPFGITDAARNQALANVRQLWDDDVTFAFGTDTQAGPAAGLARETELLAQVLSPTEIITALTRNAARFLGLEAQIGTLEAGKAADLVLVSGDPLDDIKALANVVMVIRDGAIAVDQR